MVALPLYAIEIKLAPASPSGAPRDLSHASIQRRYEAIVEELETAASLAPVPPPGSTGEAAEYFSAAFDLIGGYAEPFYRRFLPSQAVVLYCLRRFNWFDDMLLRFVPALLFCWPTILLGQVAGRFYIEKETFAVGEPVFLYFEMANSGTETQNVHRADPYSFCSGYQIHVSTDTSPNSSCGPMRAGGSCASSAAPLGPGKSRTERILLNYGHKIDAPGDYEVKAEIHLPYAPANLEYFKVAKTSLDVYDHLRFRVDQNASSADITLEAWVELLQSSDAATRREAARTLASLAPKSLEETLMAFADNTEFIEWAPLALHRLNTDRSLEGLAALLRKTDEDTQSARYLGESGDPKWFPLLLEVAKKHVNDGAYVYPAAESGGDKALLFLVSLLESPDNEYTRPIAISALGHTGSRAAIPILLELLRSPDSATAERALYGLRDLTHRTVGGDLSNLNPQSQYPRWAQWWTREGSHAHIYKANECGEFKPLE